MELITLSIAGSALLIAGHWFTVVRERFFASNYLSAGKPLAREP